MEEGSGIVDFVVEIEMGSVHYRPFPFSKHQKNKTYKLKQQVHGGGKRKMGKKNKSI